MPSLSRFNTPGEVNQLRNLHRFYNLQKIVERMNRVANERRHEFLLCIHRELQEWLHNGVAGPRLNGFGVEVGARAQVHEANNPHYNYVEALGFAARVTTEVDPVVSAECSFWAARSLQIPYSKAFNLIAGAKHAFNLTASYIDLFGARHYNTLGVAASAFRFSQDALSEMNEWEAPGKTFVIHRKFAHESQRHLSMEEHIRRGSYPCF